MVDSEDFSTVGALAHEALRTVDAGTRVFSDRGGFEEVASVLGVERIVKGGASWSVCREAGACVRHM